MPGPRRLRPEIVAILLLGALALAGWLATRGGRMPPIFDQRYTLGPARARSVESGRPVLVFATADWCGPCRVFKRTVLIDAAVESLVRERFVPVYLNIDIDQDGAAALGVRSIPATVVLRPDGSSLKLEGAVSAEQYLAWLNAALQPRPD